MPKSNLESALDFYRKTIDSTLEERAAVGRDHINWLVNASEDAARHIAVLEKLVRYVAATNYHTIPPEYHGLLDKLLEE